jgi:hypothetical protein
MNDGSPHFESWKRQFLQDFFHNLGQSITALHGTIELALRKKMTVSDHREVLKQALHLTSRLIEITRTERELAESTDPGNVRPFDLVDPVRRMLEEFRPVLGESGMTAFFQHQQTSLIRADPERIAHALFLLFDHLARSNRKSHAQLLAWVGDIHSEVVLYLGPTASEIYASRTRAEYCPAAPPPFLLINLVKAAGGRIQILQTSDSIRFLLAFPVHQTTDNVSAAPLANFNR